MADLSPAPATEDPEMNTRIIMIAILGALVSSPALATGDDLNGREKRALGVSLAAGGVAGAAIAGPPGALVGMLLAGFGADRELTARRADGYRDEVLALEIERRSLLSERASMKASMQELTDALAQAWAQGAESDAGLLADGLELAVPFRTGSAVPPEEAGEGLAALAALIVAVPALDVYLDGYADPRGSDRLNQHLPWACAEAIRDRLAGSGVNPERIHITAHGAPGRLEPGTDADPDGWALQRRVNIRVERRDGRLAAAP
jgi:outer membrane protein OmpA-like peptidoglycan-associated protein